MDTQAFDFLALIREQLHAARQAGIEPSFMPDEQALVDRAVACLQTDMGAIRSFVGVSRLDGGVLVASAERDITGVILSGVVVGTACSGDPLASDQFTFLPTRVMAAAPIEPQKH